MVLQERVQSAKQRIENSFIKEQPTQVFLYNIDNDSSEVIDFDLDYSDTTSICPDSYSSYFDCESLSTITPCYDPSAPYTPELSESTEVGNSTSPISSPPLESTNYSLNFEKEKSVPRLTKLQISHEVLSRINSIYNEQSNKTSLKLPTLFEETKVGEEKKSKDTDEVSLSEDNSDDCGEKCNLDECKVFSGDTHSFNRQGYCKFRNRKLVLDLNNVFAVTTSDSQDDPNTHDSKIKFDIYSEFLLFDEEEEAMFCNPNAYLEAELPKPKSILKKRNCHFHDKTTRMIKNNRKHVFPLLSKVEIDRCRRVQINRNSFGQTKIPI